MSNTIISLLMIQFIYNKSIQNKFVKKSEAQSLAIFKVKSSLTALPLEFVQIFQAVQGIIECFVFLRKVQANKVIHRFAEKA